MMLNLNALQTGGLDMARVAIRQQSLGAATQLKNALGDVGTLINNARLIESYILGFDAVQIHDIEKRAEKH